MPTCPIEFGAIQAIDPVTNLAIRQYLFFALTGESEITIKYHDNTSFHYFKLQSIEGTPKTLKDNPEDFVALLHSNFSIIDTLKWSLTSLKNEITATIGLIIPNFTIFSNVNGYILVGSDPTILDDQGSPNGRTQFGNMQAIKNFTDALWSDPTLGHISYGGRNLVGCNADFINQDFAQHGSNRYDFDGQITSAASEFDRYLLALFDDNLRDGLIDTESPIDLISIREMIKLGANTLNSVLSDNIIFLADANSRMIAKVYSTLQKICPSGGTCDLNAINSKINFLTKQMNNMSLSLGKKEEGGV